MKRKHTKHCGSEKCCTSTGICESTTHGSGHLDNLGYWEFPCFVCARHYETKHNTEWPFIGTVVDPMKKEERLCHCGNKFFVYPDDDYLSKECWDCKLGEALLAEEEEWFGWV